MTGHDLLILMMSATWLVTNFLGASFTFRRIYHRRGATVGGSYGRSVTVGRQASMDFSVALEDNPIARLPCLLILDTSASMIGNRIYAINEALQGLGHEILADPEAREKVEIGVVTFGPVRRVRDFQTARDFEPPDTRGWR